MTFTDIQNLINNGAITGPTVAVCNCINSLATAAREKTGKIEGLIGKARDESDNEEKVYFNSLDPSFLVVLGIASVMGIQLHNNLKTANPELWKELNALINSKYFKTFISLPSDLTKIILSEVEDKASTGAPAFITGDGELYVSGDLMEAVFSSLQNAGAFDTGSTEFTRPELFTATQYNISREDFLNNYGTSWPIIEAYLNSIWGDLKTALANNRLFNAGPGAVAAINSFNDFTSYWAKCKELDETFTSQVEQYTNFYWIGTSEFYEGGNETTKIDLSLLFTFNQTLASTYKFTYSDYSPSLITYQVSDNRNYDSGFTKRNIYLNLYDGNYTISTRPYTGGVDVRDRLQHRDYFIKPGFGPVSMSSTPAAPDGLSQEEGAVLPSSSDNSFTNWAASNLTNYYGDRLIIGALATANIPAHNQNWFKINIPYSLGYDINLNGTTEAGDNGTVNQKDSTTISQAEENEAAGIEGTGTNTETIINIYNSEEGSEPATKDQEDSGNIELEDLPTDGWNAAGMTGIYAPTREQLQSIEAWLWSSAFLDNIGKFFQDPAEALIGLYKTYFPFSTTGSQEVVFGRVGSGISAGVTNRYHEYSLGSIHVDRVFNNYMDYTGNASIYVPFCGFQSVDLKDIMEADIELVYRVEFLTGSGVAILMVTRDNMSAPLYIWQVNVFESTPVSSLNMIGTYTAGLSMVGSAVGGAVSGGSTGGVPGAIIGGIGGAAGKVGSLAQSQHVNQGGSLSGNAAFQGPKKAYLTIRYNKNASPAGYERYEGIGTDTISSIGSFKGFVKFRDVYLSVPAPDSSILEEIESKLKEGVYI